MQKVVVAVTVGIVGVLAAAPVATAAPPDTDTGRACADIDGARVNYQSLPIEDPAPTGAEVLAEMDLRAAACKNLSYTMAVYEGLEEIGTPVMASGIPVALTNAGKPGVQFQTPVPWFDLDPPDFVCVVFTTSRSNGGVVDRAPDSGCVSLDINSTAAGSTRFR